MCGAADEHGKQAVRMKFPNPTGKAGKAKHYHKDKGTDNLSLVFSRPASVGIEIRKEFHDRIQIQQPEFFPYSSEFKVKPSAL